MKLKQAIKILKDHNTWRRFNSVGLSRKSDPKMAHPRDLGIAIDTVVSYFESKNIVNNCLACGKKTEDKADYCQVCYCRGNESYKE